MKIRTDFVTNSSSSSFVSYKLHDSEFCRYVYEKMEEQGLSYEEYSDERPASHVYFDEDSLDADINSSDYGSLYCDEYAPEYWDDWDGNFTTDIKKIEGLLDDSARETFQQILEEELKETSFMELLDKEEWDDDYTLQYRSCYREKKISDSENFHLCGKLFTLLSGCKYDENRIKKQDDMFHIMFDPDDEEQDFIDLFFDHLYAIAFDGYPKCKKEEDIEEMTRKFISIISDFLPIYGEEEAKELFEKDRKNGKFSCDVYMSFL